MKRYPDAESGNKDHWDELAEVHMRSYNTAPLAEGGHVLDPIQMAELGDVTNKSLLHLQCHIGTDTLSWARLGAEVTGVDLSPVSVRKARELAALTGLRGRFIESSIYDLPEVLDEKFDIVYTSIGVLCWLSDLSEWARIVRRFLKPDGIFYIMESHPFLNVFDDETDGLSVMYPYFHSDDPRAWPGDYPDYSDGDYLVRNGSWEWTWSIADIVCAVADAGLKLNFFHEHNSIPWKALPCMVQDPSKRGWYRLPGDRDILPLTFSLRATAP